VILVLDSNVIIAAVAARGLCAEILSLIIARHSLVMSEQIWAEVSKSLRSKIKVPISLIKEIEAILRSQARWLDPAPVSVQACRDRTDLHVLGLAHAAEAQYIISGDKDLLEVKRYLETKIVSPREFWTAGRG